MSFFHELSSYEYTDDSPESMVNVGWLGRGHDFKTAPADPELISALLALAAYPQI